MRGKSRKPLKSAIEETVKIGIYKLKNRVFTGILPHFYSQKACDKLRMLTSDAFSGYNLDIRKRSGI